MMLGDRAANKSFPTIRRGLKENSCDFIKTIFFIKRHDCQKIPPDINQSSNAISLTKQTKSCLVTFAFRSQLGSLTSLGTSLITGLVN